MCAGVAYILCAMEQETTREAQYGDLLHLRDEGSVPSLGLMAGGTWAKDPKRLVFTLSRYKFVAKMLEGQRSVVEIGSADGFASRIVKQAVQDLVAVDFDPLFIEYATATVDKAWPIDFREHDLVRSPLDRKFTAAYSLDVLEHISPEDEPQFLTNLAASLSNDGVAIIGMPSLESQAYASPASLVGHVNCQSAPQLKMAMERHFRVVFMFSMNDEVVHTGFHKMANYIFAVAVCPSIADAEQALVG
jgi:SAM-dependent methyltransferase